MRTLFIICVALTACTPAPDTRADFLANLQTLCGNTYSGEVVSTQEVDADWHSEALTLGPVACSSNEVRLPLAVGADTSRTWIVRLSSSGLSLRHQHLHIDPKTGDGSPDAVSRYGGFAAEGGTATEQSFPADDWTRQLFVEQGIPESVPNVWTLRVEPGETLAYALARPATDTAPARDFRAAFDLSD